MTATPRDSHHDRDEHDGGDAPACGGGGDPHVDRRRCGRSDGQGRGRGRRKGVEARPDTLKARRHMLGPGRTDDVLLHGVTMAPEARLANDAAAKAWLDSAADACGTAAGVVVPRASAGGASSGSVVAAATGALAALLARGGGGRPAGDPPSLVALNKRLAAFVADQTDALNVFAGIDGHAPERARQVAVRTAAEVEAALDLWRAEHGGAATSAAYEAGITPVFDARRARRYASAWAWALQDALALVSGALVPRALAAGAASAADAAPQVPSSRALLLANRAAVAEVASFAAATDALILRAAACGARAPCALLPTAQLRRLPRALSQEPIVAASSSVLAKLMRGGLGANAGEAPVYVAAFAPTAPLVSVAPGTGRIS